MSSEKPKTILFSLRAKQSLLIIKQRLEETTSEKTQTRVLREIKEKISNLTEMPKLYPRYEFDPFFRKIVAHKGEITILYRYEKDNVYIVSAHFSREEIKEYPHQVA